MGNLKFTKQYSATDDGSKVSGADLGVLETDIAAILNGGITNVNINSAAGIVESKLTFDTSAGHNHDGSNSRSITSGFYRGYVQGAHIEYVSASTVKAGSGVVELNGILYTRNSYSSTRDVTTDAHWVEGAKFSDGTEDANTWIYVYAYNDSGTSWDIKFWLQPPQYADCATDDSSVKIYRSNAGVWYRCLGAVRNNAGSDLIDFTQKNAIVLWKDPIVVTVAESSGAWSAALPCSGSIPGVSTLGYFNLKMNDGTGNNNAKSIKAFGTTKSTPSNDPDAAGTDLVCIYSGANLVWCNTDTSQQISTYDAFGGAGTNRSSIWCYGYRLDIRP